METGKPQISILMAVYKPVEDWLVEQLDSLNTQTYPNLKLYIRDDCPDFPVEERIFSEHITNFPWVLQRNEKNLGSNRTFELLTGEADGEYFAYCDQDDIWLPEKLTVLQNTIEKENARLVCSDMYIMDRNGKKIADSITDTRRRIHFQSGTGFELTKNLWRTNFASGCALIVRADTAKASFPFNPYMYYDHYLNLWSANCGRVVSIPTPLILHREHGENQSSVMQGVTDRHSYRKNRLVPSVQAIDWLCKNFPADDELKATLLDGQKWLHARMNFFDGDKPSRAIIQKYSYFSPATCWFELMLPMMPPPVFCFALWLIKHNII